MLDSNTNVALANFFVVQGSATKLRFRSEMVLCTGPKHFMLWKCIAELLGLAFGYKLVMCGMFFFHYFFFSVKRLRHFCFFSRCDTAIFCSQKEE